MRKRQNTIAKNIDRRATRLSRTETNHCQSLKKGEALSIEEEFRKYTQQGNTTRNKNNVKEEPVDTNSILQYGPKQSSLNTYMPNLLDPRLASGDYDHAIPGNETTEIPRYWIMNWEEFLAGKRFPQMRRLLGYSTSDESNEDDEEYDDDDDAIYDGDNESNINNQCRNDENDDTNISDNFNNNFPNKNIRGNTAQGQEISMPEKKIKSNQGISLKSFSDKRPSKSNSINKAASGQVIPGQDISSLPNFCQTCNEQFSTEEAYKLHMKQHKRGKSTRYIDGEKSNKEGYRCNLCNQTFSAGYTLKKHIRVHTREKPFSCDLCSERFSQWGNLRLHIQRHLGINPYRCPYCDKAYIAPSKLEVHIRGHTNERPYPCEICYSTFKSNDDLRKHMMIHANYKPFTCWLCHKSFMQPSKLKQHMKEKHMMDVDISKKDVTDKGVEYEIKILPNQE